jgi:hypothetical protein
MKVIELSKFEKRKSLYGGSQPFTMTFCYPKSGPVVVKGMRGEVDKYVNTKISPCHYFRSNWMKGKSRGYWHFNVKNAFLHLSKYKDKHQRYELTIFGEDDKLLINKWLRRVPQHYLKELDLLEEK